MNKKSNIKNQMDSHIFDTLYAIAKNNKEKEWSISVKDNGDHSIITVLHGYSDGKKVSSDTTIKEGKNIGRANQTTHYTQAILEAKSKYNKKIEREGYFVKKEIVSIESAVEKVYFPMLAQDYHKMKHKIVFPCFVQPKLDGYRCIFNTTTKNITSRTGKATFEIIKSSSIYNELLNLPPNLILDGELYIHNGDFEALGVLRKKPKKLTEKVLSDLYKIEYHIYDIVDPVLTFKERNEILKKLLVNKKMLKYTETYQVNSEEEIKEYHGKFITDNYEGTMVRNSGSLYKDNARSFDLLKYKDFQDAEFKIVDYTFEKDTSGKDEKLVVWIIAVPLKIVLDGHNTDTNLEIENGNILCKVRPKGNVQERQMLYKKCVENFDQFKGRNLWVKFFCYTADGNLRFPTTMRDTCQEYIRDIVL